MTATTPRVVSRCAASEAVRGSPPSSSTTTSIFWPTTPPLSFCSAARSSTFRFISWPSLAQGPVMGARRPIFTVPAARASPAPATARATANTDKASFVFMCSSGPRGRGCPSFPAPVPSTAASLLT